MHFLQTKLVVIDFFLPVFNLIHSLQIKCVTQTITNELCTIR